MNPIYVTKSTTASFDTDAQNCFTELCPKELAIKDGLLIVEELNKNSSKADVRAGSKDCHPPNPLWASTEEHPQLTPIKGDYLDIDVYWDIHGVCGSFGAQLIKGLPSEENYTYFVWKGMERHLHPYGACYHDLQERASTGVIEFFRCAKIKTVIVGGLALDKCVKTTAIQFSKAGFEVIVNLKSCKGLSEQGIKEAKVEMLSYGIIFVDSADDIIAQ